MNDEHPTRTRLSSVVGAGLILVGLLLFFLQRLDGLDARNLWPFFVILPGAGLLIVALFAGIGGKGLAGAGAAVTMVGLLLLYQNTFQHFESWAYAWALVFPGGFGMGWLLLGRLQDDADLCQSGWHYVLAGLAIFLVGLVFFELIIGISGKAVFGGIRNSPIWPLFFIAAGVALVYRNRAS